MKTFNLIFRITIQTNVVDFFHSTSIYTKRTKFNLKGKQTKVRRLTLTSFKRPIILKSFLALSLKSTVSSSRTSDMMPYTTETLQTRPRSRHALPGQQYSGSRLDNANNRRTEITEVFSLCSPEHTFVWI